MSWLLSTIPNNKRIFTIENGTREFNLVTDAFPIVLFTKKLEDNSRKIMEITECEILPDGSRKMNTLYRYNIKENKVVDGKFEIIGEFQKVANISKSLRKRLLENGMPISILSDFLKVGEEECIH